MNTVGISQGVRCTTGQIAYGCIMPLAGPRLRLLTRRTGFHSHVLFFVHIKETFMEEKGFIFGVLSARCMSVSFLIYKS